MSLRCVRRRGAKLAEDPRWPGFNTQVNPRCCPVRGHCHPVAAPISELWKQARKPDPCRVHSQMATAAGRKEKGAESGTRQEVRTPGRAGGDWRLGQLGGEPRTLSKARGEAGCWGARHTREGHVDLAEGPRACRCPPAGLFLQHSP